MTLYSVSANPAPSGFITDFVEGVDNIPLRYAHWKSTGERHAGTVCLFGGRAEFIEKYYEVIAELRRRGFAVATFDWRGQGGSGRLLRNARKGHVLDFADYIEDLKIFMKSIVLPDCPPPYFALAHSAGGNILLRAATARNCWFERIVLCSPLVRLAQGTLPVNTDTAMVILGFLKTLGFSASYVPGSKRNEAWESEPFEDNKLTSDLHRFQKTQHILKEAPELGLGSPTVGWLYAALTSMALVNSNDFPAMVQVPILMIGAGSDRLVSTPAIEALALKLKVGSYITIPNARHEILQERDELRLQFWSAFDAFIPGT